MNRRAIGRAGRQPRFAGFVLPSAIFLLVILAALAAFLVNISTTQNMTSAQDIQGARAYHAARAGVEWGLYQVLVPAAAACAASTTLPAPILAPTPTSMLPRTLAPAPIITPSRILG